MKKRIFSFLLALVLLFAAVPTAFAESVVPTKYLNLSSATAGEYVDRVICKMDDMDGAVDFECKPQELPQGCSVQIETRDETRQLTLKGIPTQTGSFNFTVQLKNETGTVVTKLVCSFTVNSAAPTVSTGPNVKVFMNDPAEIYCSGLSPDGAPVSYQWYSTPYSINYGGTLLTGETAQTYRPDTSKLGTKYYYCVVSNATASTSSEVISVTVEELTVSSITVASQPSKLKYQLGETLDTTGLSVLVTMANGSTETIRDGFGIYPTKLDKAGRQTITISYKGKTCSFDVEVEEEEKVESIEVIALPKKLTYKVGERLDATGLILNVKTNKETKKVTVGYTCSPKVLETEGDQIITVTYEGKTCTFHVTVESDKEEIESIMIQSLPTKRSYMMGDRLDTTGLKINLITNKGTTTTVTSGFTCTPTVLDKKGSQIITVDYEGKTCSFTVTVEEAPVPVESPKPSEPPKSTETPEVIIVPSTAPTAKTDTQPEKHGPSKALLWVILAAACLGLAAIAVYFILAAKARDEQPDDPEDDDPDFPQRR